jgi:hypothetical protein
MKRICAAAAALLMAGPALADEGGASAWLPGQFASYAATPGDPGFSLETVFYARKASATAGTSFFRGGGLAAGLDISEQYLFLTPSYTFADPVLAGQLWLGVTFAAGRNDSSTWAVLTGPGGGMLSGGRSDSAAGLSDLYPMVSLKWQRGAHSVMTYAMASVPTGAYDPNRLAGVGLGHWALDGGMGYTFEAKGGFEFSVTAGLTCNFVNPSTGYQSGVDGHVDLGVSYALSERLYVGLAGYIYNQLSPDTGGNVRLGDFRSRVMGAGPQLGWSFELGSISAELGLRGYKEFAAENRPEGWNVFVVLSVARTRRHGGE